MQENINLNKEIYDESNPNNPHGRFQGLQDHAARLPQNIIRIAALVHCIKNDTSNTITLETFQEAVNIGAWYSDNFRDLFAKPPQYVLDAQMLNHWLGQYRNYNQRSFLRKNFVRQNGPNSLRHKDRLESALQELINTGQIRLFAENKTTWINLMPNVQQDALPADSTKNN
jgi:hypothetical protein